jgi:cholesterol oxidase
MNPIRIVRRLAYALAGLATLVGPAWSPRPLPSPTTSRLPGRHTNIWGGSQRRHRFSGNGDVLAFAYDTDRPVRGVGLGRRVPRKDMVVGPAIAGLIDLRDSHASRQKALIIEDGAVPGPLAAMLPMAMYAASYGNPGWRKVPRARRLREFAEIPLGPYRGPIDRTLTYLIMSTDNSGGKIVFENDRVHVDWPEVAEQPVFVRDDRIPATATEALHGTPVPDPLWAWTSGRSLITVHPLGGCVMADDASKGVVDHMCRVFDPTGDGVHDGLYVADGSVVPLALDVNPLLTISAIAERAAEVMIEDRKWARGPDGSRRRHPSPPPEAAPRARLTFTDPECPANRGLQERGDRLVVKSANREATAVGVMGQRWQGGWDLAPL